ncbi:hypothetical protein KIPB_001216 [Kipferlia bialata]|uniref:PAS domain-containing protein n=1 Tax=Kipferlia bialata TaxID=797122 RepID=A0A9K3CRR8_9EUKA|nr:hypothetical protein KIPB_001216 [Kipferlia bialata]|eukprot:g1216.t1
MSLLSPIGGFLRTMKGWKAVCVGVAVWAYMVSQTTCTSLPILLFLHHLCFLSITGRGSSQLPYAIPWLHCLGVTLLALSPSLSGHWSLIASVLAFVACHVLPAWQRVSYTLPSAPVSTSQRQRVAPDNPCKIEEKYPAPYSAESSRKTWCDVAGLCHLVASVGLSTSTLAGNTTITSILVFVEGSVFCLLPCHVFTPAALLRQTHRLTSTEGPPTKHNTQSHEILRYLRLRSSGNAGRGYTSVLSEIHDRLTSDVEQGNATTDTLPSAADTQGQTTEEEVEEIVWQTLRGSRIGESRHLYCHTCGVRGVSALTIALLHLALSFDILRDVVLDSVSRMLPPLAACDSSHCCGQGTTPYDNSLSPVSVAADDILDILQGLVGDPRFLPYRRRLRHLCSSLIRRSLYTDTAVNEKACLVGSIAIGHQPSTLPRRPTAEVRQFSLDLSKSPCVSDVSDSYTDTSQLLEDLDLHCVLESSSPKSSPLFSPQTSAYTASTFAECDTSSTSRTTQSTTVSSDMYMPLWLGAPPSDYMQRHRPLRCSFHLSVSAGSLEGHCVRVYMYRSWLDLLGIKSAQAEEAEVQAFPRNIHPQDVHRVLTCVRSVVTGDTRLCVEYQQMVRCKDGVAIYAKMRTVGSAVQWDDMGKPTMIAGYSEKLLNSITPTSAASLRHTETEARNAPLRDALNGYQPSVDSHRVSSGTVECDTLHRDSIDVHVLHSSRYTCARQCPTAPSIGCWVKAPSGKTRTLRSIKRYLMTSPHAIRGSPPVSLPRSLFRPYYSLVTCESGTDMIIAGFQRLTARKESRELLQSSVTNTAFNAHDFAAKMGGFSFGWLLLYAFLHDNQCPPFVEQLSFRALVKVTLAIHRLHRRNPFHNGARALDSLQLVILASGYMHRVPVGRVLLPSPCLLLVMLASVAQDLDHPGLTLDYLRGTDHPLTVVQGRVCPRKQQAAALLRYILARNMVFAYTVENLELASDCIVGTHPPTASAITYQLPRLAPFSPGGKCVTLQGLAPSVLTEPDSRIGHAQKIVMQGLTVLGSLSYSMRHWKVTERFARSLWREEHCSGILEVDAGLTVPSTRIARGMAPETAVARVQVSHTDTHVIPFLNAVLIFGGRSLGTTGVLAHLLLEQVWENRERWEVEASRDHHSEVMPTIGVAPRERRVEGIQHKLSQRVSTAQ